MTAITTKMGYQNEHLSCYPAVAAAVFSALKSDQYNSSSTALRSRSGARGWESRANLQWQRESDQPVHCLFPLDMSCFSHVLTSDQSSQLELTIITPGGCRKGWSWISSLGFILWKNIDIELFSTACLLGSKPQVLIEGSMEKKEHLRGRPGSLSLWLGIDLPSVGPEWGELCCHGDSTICVCAGRKSRHAPPPHTHTPCLWHWFSFWGAVDM